MLERWEIVYLCVEKRSQLYSVETFASFPLILLYMTQACIHQTSFPEITTIVDPVHQMGVKISELAAQTRLPLEAGRGIRSIDLLNAISQQIKPQTDIEITRLVAGSDGITVTGNTDSFNSVDEIKSQMEQSELIETVTTASANKEKRGNRIQFKLKISLSESTN